MEFLTVREYRNNLSKSFDRVDQGEQVVIRRNNRLYALTPIGDEDITFAPQFQTKINSAVAAFQRSMEEVKNMEAGIMPTKSAMNFLDEL